MLHGMAPNVYTPSLANEQHMQRIDKAKLGKLVRNVILYFYVCMCTTMYNINKVQLGSVIIHYRSDTCVDVQPILSLFTYPYP
jgi:hypothetical protein